MLPRSSAPLLLGALAVIASLTATAQTLPSGFQATVTVDGLNTPTAVAFSPDGRIFVNELAGQVKVFSGPSAAGQVLIDIRTQVMQWGDRGLAGLALHPDFPHTPYLYVFYAYDAPIGMTAPVYNDVCNQPNGCIISGRVTRFTIPASVPATPLAESDGTVLIKDNWCQQWSSHSNDTLKFGADGALYVSAGDGASFQFADDGSGHDTPYLCDDPTGQGGALRAQDVLTPGDPTAFNGAILRVDPMTGDAMPDNPLVGKGAPDDDRVVAIGLRNPFRFTMRPNSKQIWIGDVGWNTWEEIDKVVDPTAYPIQDFGWPCYEGSSTTNAQTGGYDSFAYCQEIYDRDPSLLPVSFTAPYLAYQHGVTSFGCTHDGGSSITGISFYPGGSYPGAYQNAVFFGDYARGCMWAMRTDANGEPDITQIDNFIDGGASPVDIELGPGGDLYWVDIGSGSVKRLRYQSPVARLSASTTSGVAPLTVGFDATASTTPVGGALTYDWDLDGDGNYGDAVGAIASFTYATPGNHRVTVRVTDVNGASDTAGVTISAGNTAPVPTLFAPAGGLTWAAGDAIAFSGSATDAQDGTLAASQLTWNLVIHPCATSCAAVPFQELDGVSSGTLTAPDQDAPAYLELILTATDAQGLKATTSVLLQPRTSALTFQSVPAGLALMIDSENITTPFSQPQIVNATTWLVVANPQRVNGLSYVFDSWSDGGALDHAFQAPASDTTYTVTFLADSDGDGIADVHDNCPAVANPTQADVCHAAHLKTGGCAAASGGLTPILWPLALFVGWTMVRRRRVC